MVDNILFPGVDAKNGVAYLLSRHVGIFCALTVSL